MNNLFKLNKLSILLGFLIIMSSPHAQRKTESWLNQTIPQSQLLLPNSYSNQQFNNDQLTDQEIFALSPNQNLANYSVSISGVPATENGLIEWAISSGDNQNRPFLIANKRLGEMVLVDNTGIVIARSPALYGVNRGDSLARKQTPAGAFYIQRVPAKHPGYGGDVLTFVNDDIRKVSVSIHRVWMENPSERRVQRLAHPNPNQRRISDGCINLPDTFYERIADIVDGSKIYILPETRSYF